MLSIFVLCLVLSCDSSKFTEVPMSQFEGKWKLCGRSMFENMTITIRKNDKGELIGVLDSLNDNRYVSFFMSKGDKFVSRIERKSNFEFVVKEKKLGSELFSLYDLSTTSEYAVQFHSPDSIFLSNSIYYLRIK